MLTRTHAPAVASAALLTALVAALGACAPLDQSQRAATTPAAPAARQPAFWGYAAEPAAPRSGPTFWGYAADPASRPEGPTFWGYAADPSAPAAEHTFWGYAPEPSARPAQAPVAATREAH